MCVYCIQSLNLLCIRHKTHSFIYLCKYDNNLYEMGNRVLLFLLSLLYIPACAYEYDIRSALLELDNAVESHQYYVEQHLAKIHRVKRELQYAEFDNDKYLINKNFSDYTRNSTVTRQSLMRSEIMSWA